MTDSILAHIVQTTITAGGVRLTRRGMKWMAAFRSHLQVRAS